jgi:hypothetical protein
MLHPYSGRVRLGVRTLLRIGCGRERRGVIHGALRRGHAKPWRRLFPTRGDFTASAALVAACFCPKLARHCGYAGCY